MEISKNVFSACALIVILIILETRNINDSPEQHEEEVLPRTRQRRNAPSGERNYTLDVVVNVSEAAYQEMVSLLNSTSFPILLDNSTEVTAISVTTLCFSTATGFRCKCVESFAWPYSSCVTYGACDHISGGTCTCINDMPPDGHTCQPVSELLTEVDYEVEVELNVTDITTVDYLRDILANSSYSLVLGPTVNVTHINITTVCYPNGTSIQCRCEDQFVWSYDICVKYGACDDIIDDTCGCINNIPSNGQHCQPKTGTTVTTTQNTTTATASTTTVTTNTTPFDMTTATPTTITTTPPLLHEYLISVELITTDVTLIDELRMFLNSTIYPISITEQIQISAVNITTVCESSTGAVQCRCEDQYRWPCDQCLKYRPCDNITDHTCGCIQTDGVLPPAGQSCQSVQQHNFTACPVPTTSSTTPPTTTTMASTTSATTAPTTAPTTTTMASTTSATTAPTTTTASTTITTSTQSTTTTTITTSMSTAPPLLHEYLISVELITTDVTLIDELRMFLNSTIYPISITEQIQISAVNITTVCESSTGAVQCRCEDQYRWPCDQCLKYRPCDNITDHTCGCIQTDGVLPPAGQSCQSVQQHNFTACPVPTTSSTTPPTTTTMASTTSATTAPTTAPTTTTMASTTSATTAPTTTTASTTITTSTQSTTTTTITTSMSTAPPLLHEYLISVELITTDVTLIDELRMFLNSTIYPISITEQIQISAVNITTVCESSTGAVQCRCEDQYRWPCDQCLKYRPCDNITDHTCGCIQTDGVLPPAGQSCQSVQQHNFTDFTACPVPTTSSTTPPTTTTMASTTSATTAPTTAPTTTTMASTTSTTTAPTITTAPTTAPTTTPVSTTASTTTLASTMAPTTTPVSTTAPTTTLASTMAPTTTPVSTTAPTTIPVSTTTPTTTPVSTTAPTTTLASTTALTTTTASTTTPTTTTASTTASTTTTTTTASTTTTTSATTNTTASTTTPTTTTTTTTTTTKASTTTPTTTTTTTTKASTTTPTTTTTTTTTKASTTTPTTTTTTTTKASTTTPTTTTTSAPSEFNVRLSMTLDRVFTEDLNDKSSAAYRELESSINPVLNEQYKSVTGFIIAFVTGFRQGSVIVDFVVQATQINVAEMVDANKEVSTAIAAATGSAVTGLADLQYDSPVQTEIPDLTLTGQEMTLTCGPPNIDAGNIVDATWKFNGLEIPPGRAVIDLDGNVSTLKVRDVIRADAGDYECILMGTGINVSHKGTVTSDNIRAAPNVRVQSEITVQCEEGKTQPLTCCVQSPYEVNWFDSDQSPLEPNPDNCVTHNYQITSCSGPQDKIFTCKTVNQEGYEQRTTLTIFTGRNVDCDDDTYGKGRLGDRSSQICDEGQEGTKTAECQETGWKVVEDTCIITEIKELLIDSEDLVAQEVPTFVEELDETVQEAKTQISNSSATISAIVDILDTVADVSTVVTEDVMEDILSTVDVLISDDARESWTFLNTNETLNASSRLLGSLETLSEALDGTFTIVTERILLNRTTFNNNFTANLNNSVAIDIPYISSSNVFITTIVLSTFRNVMPTRNSTFNATLFNTTSNETVNENAINGAVLLVKINETISNVTLKYNKLNTSLSLHPQCVFWNFTLFDNFGAWDDEGCRFVSEEDNIVTCSCNHLTSFSMLMSTSIPKEVKTILDIITYIGVGISLASLVICLVIEGYVWKAITRNSTAFMRHVSIVNTALSLLIADICFIIAAAVAKNSAENPGEDHRVPLEPCSTATFFMHFFYLALFFWMLVSGLLLFYRTVMVFHHMSKSTMLAIGFTLGYGCPLIIAVITVAVTAPGETYIKESEACWLRGEKSWALLAFVIPALIIVLINTLIIIVVVVKMLRRGVGDAAQVDEKHTLVVIIRCLAILTPLFGLTWGLGVGTMVDPTNIGIHIAFALFNSLQGFFILVFGTLLDSKIRALLSRGVSTPSTGSNQTRSTSGGVSSLSGLNLIGRLRGRRNVYRVSEAANSSNSNSGASESFISV